MGFARNKLAMKPSHNPFHGVARCCNFYEERVNWHHRLYHTIRQLFFMFINVFASCDSSHCYYRLLCRHCRCCCCCCWCAGLPPCPRWCRCGDAGAQTCVAASSPSFSAAMVKITITIIINTWNENIQFGYEEYVQLLHLSSHAKKGRKA